MAGYTPELKKILTSAGCRFERQAKTITRFGIAPKAANVSQ